jgi:hypothetical protein
MSCSALRSTSYNRAAAAVLPPPVAFLFFASQPTSWPGLAGATNGSAAERRSSTLQHRRWEGG